MTGQVAQNPADAVFVPAGAGGDLRDGQPGSDRRRHPAGGPDRMRAHGIADGIGDLHADDVARMQPAAGQLPLSAEKIKKPKTAEERQFAPTLPLGKTTGRRTVAPSHSTIS